MVLRCWATKPRRAKKSRAVSLASTVSAVAPRAAASLSIASAEQGADALPGRGRMHIEHVDMALAFERDEADGRALQRADQRQPLGEPFREGLLVVGLRSPGVLLRGIVVVLGQFRDRLAR